MTDKIKIPSRLEVVLTGTGLALIAERSRSTEESLLLMNVVSVPRAEVEVIPKFIAVNPVKVYQAYKEHYSEMREGVNIARRLIITHHKYIRNPEKDS